MLEFFSSFFVSNTVLIVVGFILDMARRTRHSASKHLVVGRAYGVQSRNVSYLLGLQYTHSWLIPLSGLCGWTPTLRPVPC